MELLGLFEFSELVSVFIFVLEFDCGYGFFCSSFVIFEFIGWVVGLRGFFFGGINF